MGCAAAVTICSAGVPGIDDNRVWASVIATDSLSEADEAAEAVESTEDTAAVVSLETVVSTECDSEDEAYVPAAEQVDVSGITAGVTSLITKTVTPTVTLTAGVASSLNDFDSGEVYIVAQEKIKVAAALEEEERIAREEAEAAEKAANLAEWGYENLGIAVSESTLNVRDSASTSGDVVGKLPYHAACEIVSIEDGWAQIISGDVEGYVAAEYLLTGDEAYEAALEEAWLVATVTTSSRLRVRSAPSTDASILTNVRQGEELTVLEDETDGWVYVELDNTTGYVCADYVDVSEKLETAQAVSSAKAYTSVSTYDIGSIAGTVSETRYSLVETALQYVGNPYVWGGTSLTNGVDCSGFTMKIFAMYGISLPHSSKAQPSYGKKIDISEARPGDLFFYGDGSTINHVAIYIGNGKIVHASSSKTGIKISNALYRDPICVVSYFND
ncbi:MAG: NlpC/P60 family protein [Clostridiales bacterium]|nr:NlpC/P60 family protein [Clostridiales bacterium]